MKIRGSVVLKLYFSPSAGGYKKKTKKKKNDCVSHTQCPCRFVILVRPKIKLCTRHQNLREKTFNWRKLPGAYYIQYNTHHARGVRAVFLEHGGVTHGMINVISLYLPAVDRESLYASHDNNLERFFMPIRPPSAQSAFFSSRKSYGPVHCGCYKKAGIVFNPFTTGTPFWGQFYSNLV